MEELVAYRHKQEYIAELIEKRREYEEGYTYLQATAYDTIRVIGGEYRDKIAETAIRWADLDIKVKQLQVEAEEYLWDIRRKLNLLTATQAKVLELYYIKRFSTVKVAQIMAYSEQWVRLTKHDALNRFSLL